MRARVGRPCCSDSELSVGGVIVYGEDVGSSVKILDVVD